MRRNNISRGKRTQVAINAAADTVCFGSYLGFQFCYHLVGEACWFGEAVFWGAGEGDFYSVVERAFVAYGDKKGLYVCAGSQDGADYLASVGEG